MAITRRVVGLRPGVPASVRANWDHPPNSPMGATRSMLRSRPPGQQHETVTILLVGSPPKGLGYVLVVHRVTRSPWNGHSFASSSSSAARLS